MVVVPLSVRMSRDPKVCFMLLALASLAVADEKGDPVEIGKKMLKTCQEKHKISDEQMTDHIEKKKLPETQDEKCFLDCVMTSFKVIKIDSGKRPVYNTEQAKYINAIKWEKNPEAKAKADSVVDKTEAALKAEDASKAGAPWSECEFAYKVFVNTAKFLEELGFKEDDFKN